ncbi:MAG TPA: type III-B CRISPR module-associated Cmr3 family protein, partial [Thermomicrobiales bacterium]|nr:type III-B CRISPR module-associated Cmr3 family protein [Thermomicrobiales bacterium]
MSRLHTLLLQGRDPLIFRDARPFTNAPGGRATTLPWPLPQTIAGALRTHIGNTLGNSFAWDQAGAVQARTWALKGPLLAVRWAEGDAWQVYVPAPRDALIYTPRGQHGKSPYPLRPKSQIPAGAGVSPFSGIAKPLHPIEMAEQDLKPDDDVAMFWALDQALAWLADPRPVTAPADEQQYKGLPTDTRVHVGIDKDTLTNREGALFTTSGLDFARAPQRHYNGQQGRWDETPATGLLCRMSAPPEWAPGPAFLPLGGERRLADLIAAPPELWPAPDQLPVAAHLDRLAACFAAMRQPRLRLQLVTPAIFANGWLPDGADPESLEVTIPDWPNGPRLRLVSAIV